MPVICGVPDDDGVSKYLKCFIQQKVDDQEVTIAGYISESCEVALRSTWESPFEGDSVGDAGVIDKAASIMQAETGETSKTKMNFQKGWQGIEPPEVTIQLMFIAYTDAYNEVDLPIRYLLQMMSPNLQETIPVGDGWAVGRIPGVVAFNIARKLTVDMVITDVSYDLNAPKTPDGYYARNTVSITASPKTMFNASEITNHFT